jgi:transposase
MKAPINHINGMVQSTKEQQTEASIDQNIDTTTVGQTSRVTDPQVKSGRQYRPRRSYNEAYKARILAAYNDCPNAKARGAFLRSEGLYYARICAWRNEQASGKLNQPKKNTLRVDHLTHENAQLKKKLAQAEAIIDLQKKVSELFGQHILSHDVSEANS